MLHRFSISAFGIGSHSLSYFPGAARVGKATPKAAQPPGSDHSQYTICRAPEKVFGLLDCHENLDAMLSQLQDILEGAHACTQRPFTEHSTANPDAVPHLATMLAMACDASLPASTRSWVLRAIIHIATPAACLSNITQARQLSCVRHFKYPPCR